MPRSHLGILTYPPWPIATFHNIILLFESFFFINVFRWLWDWGILIPKLRCTSMFWSFKTKQNEICKTWLSRYSCHGNIKKLIRPMIRSINVSRVKFRKSRQIWSSLFNSFTVTCEPAKLVRTLKASYLPVLTGVRYW